MLRLGANSVSWTSVNRNQLYSLVTVFHSLITVFYSPQVGLYRNAKTRRRHVKNDVYVHVDKFVDCSAFAEAANRPYINVLYANSLWCTDSRRIAFGCSPNVCHTAKCCLPRLRNTSTSNVRIVFACHIRVLFAFRCKLSFIIIFYSLIRVSFAYHSIIFAYRSIFAHHSVLFPQNSVLCASHSVLFVSVNDA